MAKWFKQDATGISIGGEFYPAEKGVVDVPDNVGGLHEYGFERVFTEDDEKQIEEAAKKAAEEEAAKKAADKKQGGK